jgi:hypothetical protein
MAGKDCMLSARDLIRLFWGRKTGGVCVVITGYFDASGKNDRPVVTVGGYIAEENVLEAIEGDWNRVLERYEFRDSNGAFNS